MINGNYEPSNLITSLCYGIFLSAEGKLWLSMVRQILENNYKALKKAKDTTLNKLLMSAFSGGYLIWIDFKNYISNGKDL